MSLALICETLAPTLAAGEEVNMFDGQWHANATLYAWFANMNTTFRVPAVVGGGSTTVEVKPSSYLKDLQFGAMLAGELRKGEWSFATDLIYADLANLSSKVKEISGPAGPIPLPVTTNVNSGVRSTVWTLVAGYTVLRNEQGNLDLIGGFRYADLKTSVNWDISGPIGVATKTGGGSDSIHPWDGIIGIKGGIRLSDDGKWRLPYEADVGWGSHQWVWNGIIGIGYKFGWGDLSLAFRNLAYSADSDQTLQKFRMRGPALAFTFTW